MEEIYHIPAMLKETIEGLAIKPNGVYVDVTFGGGGHSRAILAELHGIKNEKLKIKNEVNSGNYAAEQDKEENAAEYHREQNKEEGSRIPSGGMDDVENAELKPREQNEEKNTAEYSREQDKGEGSRMISGGKEEGKKEKEAEIEKGGRLFSFDQDIEAYENAIKGAEEDRALMHDAKWTFVHSNFRYLRNWMDYYGVKEIDGLLADLGVSFHHFDCPERGFSFRFSAPLDMRMNQTAKRTAADIVNGYSEEELAKLFWLYGELKNGRGIARNICKARSQKPILRTEELVAAAMNMPLAKLTGTEQGATQGEEEGNPPRLADVRELEIPTQYKKDLARLFQALRIEVNDEMGALREMLVAARDLLKPGGRIAILTYHSLEDRLVKNFLRSGNLEGTIEKDFYGNNLSPFEVIEKGREASEEEVERNPRARSAKLRVAEKR